MKRTLLKNMAVFLILCLAAITVVAGFRPSFGGSNNGSIEWTLQWQGTAESITVTLESVGGLTAVCQNNGGNEAPGQGEFNYGPYTDVASFTNTKGVKTHVFEFVGFESAPGKGDGMALPSGREAGCPNSNWTVSRLVGTLRGEVTAIANGRTELFYVDCEYNSAIKGEMTCTEEIYQ